MAAAAALAVPAALAGSASGSNTPSSHNSGSSLASAQQRSDHLSAATRQRLNSISTQVNALLGKMTVAEKIGQLEMAGPAGANGTPGQPLLDAAKAGEIGSVLDLTGVANINQVQQAALQSRLHIPLIFSLDVIHGYKTIFPVPIAEASSWDPTAIGNDESISASEATADGDQVDVQPDGRRQPRPALGPGRRRRRGGPLSGVAIAAAKVRGYQGSDFSVADKMAAKSMVLLNNQNHASSARPSRACARWSTA